MTAYFTYEEGSILVRLLLSHFLVDFFLQPDKWVAAKKNKIWKSEFLWYHGLLAGGMAWLLLFDLRLWWVAVVVAGLHVFIDGVKMEAARSVAKNNATAGRRARVYLRLFVVDQLCHVLVIVLVWLALVDGWQRIVLAGKEIFPDYRFLTRILGYVLVLQPVGYLIGFLTRRWTDDLNIQDSLKDAGKWIGMLERVLILTFVYIGQFAAIGFLITAKSLLRVIDKPDRAIAEPGHGQPFSSRKHTEYVLIGTFLSFSISLMTGLLVNHFLR